MKLSQTDPFESIRINSVSIYGRLQTEERRVLRQNRSWWQSETKGIRWLTSPLVFVIDSDQGQFWFDAPVNFRTDYYSYPIRPQSITGRNEASVGHDRLYELPVVWNVLTGRHIVIDRKTCDEIFDSLMSAVDTQLVLRVVRYAAVRIGGQSGWDFYRGLDAEFEAERVMPDV